METEEETERTKAYERQGKIIADAIAPQLSAAISVNAVQAGAAVAAVAGPPGPMAEVPAFPPPPPPSVANTTSMLSASQRAYIVAECGHV